MHFPKMKPQVVSYRKYKDFHNETFLDSLRHQLKEALNPKTIFLHYMILWTPISH